MTAGATLNENAQIVNDLNVFPIPDGDTGENMMMTMRCGLDRVRQLSEKTVTAVASAMAQGMLLGARGNSGVILSQLFFGLSEGLKGLEAATLPQFAHALKTGVECAYGAVAKPVEGTILTVARESAANACDTLTDDMGVSDFMSRMLVEMKESLAHTPDLLPVLKEAGVIDSGGAGLVYIMEGFCKAVGGEVVEVDFTATGTAQATVDFSKFNENSVMEYGYCTEFLLQLQRCKTDVDAFSVDALIEFLNTVGDSIVAFRTGTVIKVHVHTMTPWKVLEYSQRYGEFLTVKIENMTLQHNELETPDQKPEENRLSHREFATVTVANGAGLEQLFRDLGADEVVNGGQTNNPSAEDFLRAYDKVNADVIFVLPNNGNILLAARQAAEMYDKADVRVIESKSIGQGYSALSMLDYSSGNADEIEAEFKQNIGGVVTGMVTHSIRSASLNGVDINCADYIGFTDKTMLVSHPSKMEATFGLLEKLNAAERDCVIALYGKGATADERNALDEHMGSTYPNVEYFGMEGGQDVYDFLLIIE